jgi:nucleoside-diphosphate-sugar epimerase
MSWLQERSGELCGKQHGMAGKAMKELGFTPKITVDEGMRRIEAQLRSLEPGKSSTGERIVERGRP